jgi:hypothetical protein
VSSASAAHILNTFPAAIDRASFSREDPFCLSPPAVLLSPRCSSTS